MWGATQQRSTSDNEVAHAPAQNTPPWWGPHTGTACPTVGGGGTPTKHALPMGGARKNAANPTMKGATHQHSTNPGQANNTSRTATRPPINQPKHTDRKGAKTTPNQQNKPRMALAKAQPTRKQRRRLAGGTDDDNPSPAPPHSGQPRLWAGTNTARSTMRLAMH